MTKTLAIALAAVSMAASAQASAAMQNYRQTSTTVRYGDLDLTTVDGREQLDRRIASAVRRVCAGNGKLAAHERRDVSDCMRSARDRAGEDVELALRSGSVDFAQRR